MDTQLITDYNFKIDLSCGNTIDFDNATFVELHLIELLDNGYTIELYGTSPFSYAITKKIVKTSKQLKKYNKLWSLIDENKVTINQYDVIKKVTIYQIL